jgi:two-component system chemotaxis response regulator CheY
MSSSLKKVATILITDDEEDIRDMLCFCIKGMMPCEVLQAPNGLEAIKILSARPIDLIICDYNMPSKNGGEVYKYILENKSQCRFVLCSSERTVDHSEFDNNVALFGQLQKPNMIEGLKELINQFKNDLQTEDAQVSSHVPISLNLLNKLKEVPTDIYLKLTSEKYVKVLNQGQTFETGDFEKYTQKKIAELYCLNSDFELLLARIQKEIMVLNSLSSTPEVSQQLQIHELLLNTFRQYGLQESFIPYVQKQVTDTFELLQKEKKLSGILCKILEAKTSYVGTHSFMLAAISTILVSKLDWSSEGSITKLIMSSLMHDIFLEESNTNESEQLLHKNYSADFKDHPQKASNFLNQIHSIPPDISRIILEQHEISEESGVPYGLNANRISKLGSLFSFSHFIVDFILEEHAFGKVDTRSIYKNMERVSTNSEYQKLLKHLREVKIFTEEPT